MVQPAMAAADQFALVNRLHALVRDVPDSHLVTLWAGELRVLLESLAAFASPTSKPSEPLPPHPTPDVRKRAKRPRGSVQPLLIQHLTAHPAGGRIIEIAAALGLNQKTVLEALNRGPFQRDLVDRYVWKLRSNSHAGADAEEKRVDHHQ
jgi:hypothetical protein